MCAASPGVRASRLLSPVPLQSERRGYGEAWLITRLFLLPVSCTVESPWAKWRGVDSISTRGERGGRLRYNVTRKHILPVMLQSSLSVGASPEYWLIMPLLAACGTGIVNTIGLWNFRRRGSTVTIGETATRFPSSFATSSAGIGWAWNLSQDIYQTCSYCSYQV